MLKHFNPNHLERICSYLTLGEISSLSLVSKKMHIKFKDQKLEGIWIINTYNTFMSKAGYTGMRNLNLIKIDKFLREIN